MSTLYYFIRCIIPRFVFQLFFTPSDFVKLNYLHMLDVKNWCACAMWYIDFDDFVIPSSVMVRDDTGSGLWKKVLVAFMTTKVYESACDISWQCVCTVYVYRVCVYHVCHLGSFHLQVILYKLFGWILDEDLYQICLKNGGWVTLWWHTELNTLCIDIFLRIKDGKAGCLIFWYMQYVIHTSLRIFAAYLIKGNPAEWVRFFLWSTESVKLKQKQDTRLNTWTFSTYKIFAQKIISKNFTC